MGGVQKVTILVPSSFSKQLTFINIFINLIFLCCLKCSIGFFSIIVESICYVHVSDIYIWNNTHNILKYCS